jgi:hypothetical protein
MNKREAAEVEALREELSLSFPRYPEPIPLDREEILYQLELRAVEALPVWIIRGHVDGYVCEAWTDGMKYLEAPHKRVPDWARQLGSRVEGRNMYPTKLAAWQALRWLATRECMKRLRRADVLLEQECPNG